MFATVAKKIGQTWKVFFRKRINAYYACVLVSCVSLIKISSDGAEEILKFGQSFNH